ncbi:MAG: hypothetical protein ACREQD_12805, partial [Candidatus Binataceae bacterium]
GGGMFADRRGHSRSEPEGLVDEKFGVSTPRITLSKRGAAVSRIGGKSAFSPVADAGDARCGFGLGSFLRPIARRAKKGLRRCGGGGQSGNFRLLAKDDVIPMLDSLGQHWGSPRRPPATAHEIAYHGPSIEGLFPRIEQWTALGKGTTCPRGMLRDDVAAVCGLDVISGVPDATRPRKLFSCTTAVSGLATRACQSAAARFSKRRRLRLPYPVTEGAFRILPRADFSTYRNMF